MYLELDIFTGEMCEVEKIHTSRYKSKKFREAKKNLSEEAVQKNNAKIAAKKLRWIINTNFHPGDQHVVLTYSPEQRAECPEQAKKDLANFFRRLKTQYKKHGIELKYVAVTEYGQRSMHHHIVINKCLSLEEIAKVWGRGHIHSTPLDDTADYSRLASYLIKQTNKTYNDPQRRVSAKRWNASTNMAKPIIHRRVVKADSWRETPNAPKGYTVIPGTISCGVNDFTGYPYMYYTCRRQDRPESKRYKRNKQEASRGHNPGRFTKLQKNKK